jgi:hypothetical protein
MRGTTLLGWLLAIALAWAQQEIYRSSSPVSAGLTIDLSEHFNNQASSLHGKVDGTGFKNGSTFPSEFLPRGEWVDEGVMVGGVFFFFRFFHGCTELRIAVPFQAGLGNKWC